jgi:hypothetical protein
MLLWIASSVLWAGDLVPAPSGAVVMHPYSDEAVAPGRGGFKQAVPDPNVTIELLEYQLPVRPLDLSAGGAPGAVCLVKGTTTNGSVHAAAMMSWACGAIEPAATEAIERWRFRVVTGDPAASYSFSAAVRFRENEATGRVDLFRDVLVGDPAQTLPGLQFATPLVPRKRVAPKYPPEARTAEATCHVRFDIDERGMPVGVALEDCPDVFADRAEAAAWKWRFKPYVVDGKPERMQYFLAVKFRQT